jgi:hypothetical protein
MESLSFSHKYLYKLQRSPFTTLALRNLKFEEGASRYAENTLKRKVKTQSSPWVAPPQIVHIALLVVCGMSSSK